MDNHNIYFSVAVTVTAESSAFSIDVGTYDFFEGERKHEHKFKSYAYLLTVSNLFLIVFAGTYIPIRGK